MNEQEKDFWRKLDIPIDYILDLELQGKDLVARIDKNVEDKEAMLSFLNSYFKLKSKNLREALSLLWSEKKDLLFNMYAVFFFARKLKENLISKRWRNSEILKQFDFRKDTDLKIKLLPIFFEEKSLLITIYYDFLITSTNMKTFVSSRRIEIPDIRKRLNKKSVESLFLRSQTRKSKRRIQLWDLLVDEDKTKIFFRVESKVPMPIRFVDSNRFYKTASWRTLIFSEDGNKLEIFAKSKPSETLKIANELMAYLTGLDINYEEIAKRYEPTKFVNFVRKVRSGQIKQVKLFGIERRNAPLSSSPNLTIESQANIPINPALEELERLGINLTSDIANIVGLKIELNQRTYRLKFRIENNHIAVVFNNRNIPEAEKESVVDFLDENAG